MSDVSSDAQADVLIVGAGFAGLYMLHRVRGLGLSALVLEAGAGVGGTWYWNRYPGARCDIESLQYSYQFDDALQQEWDWSQRYAPQPELLGYAEHVARRHDLYRDIRFDTPIESAHYHDSAPRWRLRARDGRSFLGRFCVMATGCLSVPNWPRIPGLDDFAGPVLHTARWPQQPPDLAGKRIGVIGTGSSAIQCIPLLAEEAARLVVFQRTANYSVPAHNGALDAARLRAVKADYAGLRARARRTHPGIDGEFSTVSALEVPAAARQAEYERRWREGGLTFMGAFGDLMLSQQANDTAADFVRDKIRAIVADPVIAERLCPTNIIGGKRLCVDSGYFATFNRDNVTLVDVRATPIEAVSAGTLRVAGEDIALDVLVVATGFDAMTGALTAIDIRGRDGQGLHERWRDGPCSYLGLAMTDFPNLFTITGPGSPSVFTNMLPTIEQHVDWIAACLAHLQSAGLQRIEARAAAEQAWWQHVQEVAGIGLKASTDSWYVGANVEGKARVFMPYYGGFPAYCERCAAEVASGYEGFMLS